MSAPTGLFGIMVSIVVGVLLPFWIDWEIWQQVLLVIGFFMLLSLLEYFLFERRLYRAEGKKALVKHGLLGKWGDLEEHIKNDT